MTKQTMINIALWSWTSLHDFVYAGIGYLFVRAHLIKRHNTSDERLDRIEQHLGIPTTK